MNGQLSKPTLFIDIVNLTCSSLDPYSYLMVAIDFFSLLSLCLFVFYGFFFIAMGGSTFFFVEFKTFEFSLGEGGTFYCNVLSVELSSQACVSSDSVLLPLVNPRSQNLNKVATMTTIVFTSSTGNISVVGKSALKVHPGG